MIRLLAVAVLAVVGCSGEFVSPDRDTDGYETVDPAVDPMTSQERSALLAKLKSPEGWDHVDARRWSSTTKIGTRLDEIVRDLGQPDETFIDSPHNQVGLQVGDAMVAWNWATPGMVVMLFRDGVLIGRMVAEGYKGP